MRVMMDTVAASAPGKVILFGEHSVVYGKPAVAASLSDLRIRADCSVFSKEENYDESSSNNATVTTKSPPILLMELPDLNLTCSVPLPCLLETRHALHAPPTAACVLELEQLVRRLSHRHWPDGRKRRFGSTTAEANNDSDTNTDDSAAMVHALLPVLYLVAQLTPLHMLKQDNISLRVQVASTGLPCSAGLGSSAAFGVALAAALYQWQQRQSRTESSSENVVTHNTVPSATDINTINTHAYHSEILLHGRPSGIDNTVSSHGGALLFTRNYHHEVHLDPVPLARPLRLLLVHTHVPRHTKSLVAQVRALHDKYPRVVQPILDAMGQIAVTFCEMQQQSAVTTTTMSKMGNANVTNETLLTLVRTNQRLLSALGVSHDCLDRICAAVLRTCPKAAAAKLTGAGGGGCAMIVLCGGTDNHSKNNDKEEAQLMAEIQRAAGTEYTYTFLSSTVGGDGVLFVAPEPWSSISMTREDRSAWGVLTSRLLGMTTTETTTTTVTSRWWTVAMGAAAVSAGLLLVRTHKGR